MKKPKAILLDTRVEQVVIYFSEQIRTRFDIDELIVFGSYARGTASIESDLDVAVVFKNQIPSRSEILISLCDLAYEILLETGLDISPYPLSVEDLRSPESYSNPYLIKNILAEGIHYKCS